MVTVRVQRKGVRQPHQGAFFGYRTPLGSVGAQMHTDECCELQRGLQAKHPFQLIRIPEEAPSGPDLQNKFSYTWA